MLIQGCSGAVIKCIVPTCAEPPAGRAENSFLSSGSPGSTADFTLLVYFYKKLPEPDPASSDPLLGLQFPSTEIEASSQGQEEKCSGAAPSL